MNLLAVLVFFLCVEFMITANITIKGQEHLANLMCPFNDIEETFNHFQKRQLPSNLFHSKFFYRLLVKSSEDFPIDILPCNMIIGEFV